MGETIMLFIKLMGALRESVNQHFCEHLIYTETRSCDGICIRCKKNLGFIQKLRNDKTKVEKYNDL